MKKIFLILTVNIICIAACVAVCYQLFIPKTAFVDVNRLYEEFDLKKELETNLLQVESERKKILDSLESNLNFLVEKIKEDEKNSEKKKAFFNLKRNEYLETAKQFEEDDNALAQKYREQILTQLNQYVQDYGRQENYDFLFGNSGDGSVMYAQEVNDKTEDVLIYINNKYKGI